MRRGNGNAMKRCLGCMGEIPDEAGECPKCGYKQGTLPDEAYYLEPGVILNERYLVGKVLGYGGFGVTYIGWDMLLNRIIAIKEYFPSNYSTRAAGSRKLTIYSGSNYEEFQMGLESFLTEAKRLAQMKNIANVVEIYDCIKENNTGYIIMEYLDGSSIKEILKRQGKYSYWEAEKIILSVLNTLAKVHKEGLIHRDIAPDNIFLTKKNEIKLIDFGAARYAASVRSRSLSVFLKQGYAPPEQYSSHGNQGPWTDIYGVGATFYVMITDVIPEESVERMIKDELIPPSQLGVDIAPEKEKVLLTSMEIKQEKRFQTAEEFIQALNNSNEVKKNLLSHKYSKKWRLLL